MKYRSFTCSFSSVSVSFAVVRNPRICVAKPELILLRFCGSEARRASHQVKSPRRRLWASTTFCHFLWCVASSSMSSVTVPVSSKQERVSDQRIHGLDWVPGSSWVLIPSYCPQSTPRPWKNIWAPKLECIIKKLFFIRLLPACQVLPLKVPSFCQRPLFVCRSVLVSRDYLSGRSQAVPNGPHQMDVFTDFFTSAHGEGIPNR